MLSALRKSGHGALKSPRRSRKGPCAPSVVVEDSLVSWNKLYSRAMNLHVVGCSGGLARGRQPSTYVVDGCLAVDAGALASGLERREQDQIATVLLTHCH